MDKWKCKLSLPRLGSGPDLHSRHSHWSFLGDGSDPEVQQQQQQEAQLQWEGWGTVQGDVWPVQEDWQSPVRRGGEGEEDPATWNKIREAFKTKFKKDFF